MEQVSYARRGFALRSAAGLGLLSAIIVTGTTASGSAQAAERTLYSFTAPAGAAPGSLVTTSDGSLFGTTTEGGVDGGGTLFQFTSSGVNTLHSFTGTDGAGPGVMIDGGDGYLYGATSERIIEPYNSTPPPIQATIFRTTRTGQLTVLYTFPVNNAEIGVAALVMSNGVLYGISVDDGASGFGTLFSLTVDGGIFTVLHSFANGSDGADPNQLILDSDGNFYGSTLTSASGGGTLFRLTPSGTFDTIYTFAPPPPYTFGRVSALMQGQDGALYGGTFGVSGSVFRFSTVDDTLSAIYTFNPTPPMVEAGPDTLLQAANGLFYGSSNGDGTAGQGTLFQLSTLGDYQSLYSFSGTRDGGAPTALVMDPTGVELFGATPAGIGAAGQGSLFRLQLSSAAFKTLYAFRYPQGEHPNNMIKATDGRYYGTTTDGGNSGDGTIFRIAPNGALQTLYSFSGGADGAAPISLMQANDGSFYGRASSGGADGNGTLFHFTQQQGLTPIYAFTGAGNGTGTPLVQCAGGDLYGTGASGDGQIFRITPSGTLTNLFVFTGNPLDAPDGLYPSALICGSDSNLYGTTRGLLAPAVEGPAGSVFTLNNSNAFRTIFDFLYDPNSFAPVSLIQGSDGSFYGTTNPDLFDFSDVLAGSVFRVDGSGNFATLHSFDGADGVGPQNVLEGGNGNFYGYTAGYDPSPDQGSVFELTPDGTFTTLYSFHQTDVNENGYVVQPTSLIESGSGRLYGTTLHGGAAGSGSIFEVDEPKASRPKQR